MNTSIEALKKRVKKLEKEVLSCKRIEKVLRESEGKYRLLVKNIPSIVYKGYKDWSVEFFDKKIKLFTGYDFNEFNSRKMKWIDIIIKEDIKTARESFIQALKTDKSYVREYRIKSKSGDIHWIHERSQIICDNKGEIEHISGIFLDITERKQAEEELRRHRDCLEELVAERTDELGKINKELQQENTRRKLVEEALQKAHDELERRVKKRTRELEIKTSNLEEVNTALKVLLKQRENDRTELEEKVLFNIKELVTPFLNKLKKTNLDAGQMDYVNVLESNLNDIISPFVRRFSLNHLKLTPSEIQIANLVKQGMTSKQIAKMFNLSRRTIETRRKNIRDKLGLKSKKANLRTYLLSTE